ncbi:MAG: hypothetical protein WDN45_05605 [Caulobacteraceae bacterium]
MRTARLLAPSAAALLLTACAVGPDYRAPDLHLSQSFHAAPAAPGAQPLPLKSWWTAFGDPELNRVVERVRGQNLQLAEAAARVGQSRAAAKAAGAALLPALSADGGATSARQSLQSPIGEVARGLPASSATTTSTRPASRLPGKSTCSAACAASTKRPGPRRWPPPTRPRPCAWP